MSAVHGHHGMCIGVVVQHQEVVTVDLCEMLVQGRHAVQLHAAATLSVFDLKQQLSRVIVASCSCRKATVLL